MPRGRPKLKNPLPGRIKGGTPIKFDEPARKAFFKHLAETGLVHDSAVVAGVSNWTICEARKSSAAFEERFQDAKAAFRDKVLAHANKLCLEGAKTVYYGKDGEIKSEQTRYPERLLEVLIKKVDPESREKQQIDHTIRGGVIAVPVTTASAEDWESTFGAAVTAPTKAKS